MIAAITFVVSAFSVVIIYGEPGWLVRLFHWLGIRKGVALIHDDGEESFSFLRFRKSDGQAWCYRMSMRIGVATLLPNGEVQQPNYIRSWSHLK